MSGEFELNLSKFNSNFVWRGLKLSLHRVFKFGAAKSANAATDLKFTICARANARIA